LTPARQLGAVLLFVLALRLPFLNQAIQGDDIDYLYAAEHAQIDPLHPTHVRYVFLGQMVDMRGHPHPPLNAWFLGLLLAGWKDIGEVPFHAAYILFSLIAAASALSLARRFSSQPLAATLLFLVTLAFVVNGNSLESDLPLVAFWLASVALFTAAVDRRSLGLLAWSALVMALAALAAYQAVALVPILWFYGRKWKPAWVAALATPAVLGLWQLFERASSGALPAGMLAGYLQTYGFEALTQKLRSAGALTGHMGWLVFPLLAFAGFRHLARWVWLPLLTLVAGAVWIDPNPLYWISAAAGLLILAWCATHWRDFLAAWVLVFFAVALAIFFAGSARYLLPLALPVAILTSRQLSAKWLYAGVAAQLAVSLALAIVNYQHWDGYRQFARTLAHEAQTKRVWINDEWGLRYYLEAEGALPLLANQVVHPGEIVVSNHLGAGLPFSTGGGILVPVAQREITSRIPLRLVSMGGKSAYSAVMFGLRPFDIVSGPIDRVTAEVVVERKPTLTRLLMSSPESSSQIVSGIYSIENNQFRWMAGQGVLLLKSPPGARPLEIHLYIPPQTPAREVAVAVDNAEVARQTYPGPGTYTLVTKPIKASGDSAQITIAVDKTFSVPSDRRELGIILTEVGFAQ
jgi:hypothetical protein